MKIKPNFLILFLVLTICLFPVKSVFAGEGPPLQFFTFPQTDNPLPLVFEGLSLHYVFDLRDRETFLQFTYLDQVGFGSSATAHVQIFNVADNCNENNFFDVYTVSDTHVYNMREIQTNDGNPSGVVLPDDAYGIVVITLIADSGEGPAQLSSMGNLRIINNNGYEYRTNAQSIITLDVIEGSEIRPAYTFNFNTKSGVTLSDIFGITVNVLVSEFPPFLEWDASNILTAFNPFDIDIVDNNETIFSCRDVTFACVNQDHPLLEELLAESGTSVASFEYGINNAIPHSKGGELLCPGNTISEGFVTLQPETQQIETEEEIPFFLGYVGLNNGNGRGSFDSFWTPNLCLPPFDLCEFQL